MGFTTEPREESVKKSEKEKKLSLIESVDNHHASPAERAKRVLLLLQNTDVDTWDVLCFCAEYMGMMSAAWPWLEMDAKRFARLVYTAHYEHFGTELGPQEQRKLSDVL